MKTKVLLVSTLALLGVTAAGAALASNHASESNHAYESASTEIQLLKTAKVSLDQAGRTALGAVPGTLMDVGFNDENGKGVYEATVLDAKGQLHRVKVDAMSGQVLAQGMAGTEDGEGDTEHGASADGEHADAVNQ